MMMMPRRPPSASSSSFPLTKFFVVLFLLHVDPVVCCRRCEDLDLFLEELEFQKILRKMKHFNEKHISLFLVLPLNPPAFFAWWRSSIFELFYLISSLLRRRGHSKPSPWMWYEICVYLSDAKTEWRIRLLGQWNSIYGNVVEEVFVVVFSVFSVHISTEVLMLFFSWGDLWYTRNPPKDASDFSTGRFVV